jgi:regulator of nonsense transcripts 2
MADAAADDLEAQLEALSAIEELKKEKDELIAQRTSNSAATAQVSRKAHEANKKNLKSDLKKTTAFVKKIRSINTEGLQQCIRDVETLNLNLYISEIVGAIVETAYKATDVPSMVKLCISLHKRYDEFTTPLLAGLRTALMAVPAEDDKDAGKRKRIQIRFVIELFQVGICTDESFFADLLRSLVGKSKG